MGQFPGARVFLRNGEADVEGTTSSVYTPRGAWNSGTLYNTADWVTYDNGTTVDAWVALQDNAGQTPTEGINWTLLAAQGDPGIDAAGTDGQSVNPAGDWDGITTYEPLDLVRHDAEGASFVAMIQNAGVEPTLASPEPEWMVSALDGVEGSAYDDTALQAAIDAVAADLLAHNDGTDNPAHEGTHISVEAPWDFSQTMTNSQEAAEWAARAWQDGFDHSNADGSSGTVHPAAAISVSPTVGDQGQVQATLQWLDGEIVNTMIVADAADTAISDHLADLAGKHNADQIAVEDPEDVFTATDVEAVLFEIHDNKPDYDYVNNADNANVAAISAEAATRLAADNALQTNIDDAINYTTDHLNDAVDAHDASAISVADAGNYYTGDTVEAALQEIGAGGIGGGGPVDAVDVAVADAGNLYVAANAEAALAEVMQAVVDHAALDENVHDAGAISFADPFNIYESEDVEMALTEAMNIANAADSEAIQALADAAAAQATANTALSDAATAQSGANTANSGLATEITNRQNADNALQSNIDAKQPLDADLTTIAAIDAGTAGALTTDGSGWIRKSYAQLKTALGLTKADVGLANVANALQVTRVRRGVQIEGAGGGTTAIATGELVASLTVPFDCTIKSWRIISVDGTSGSIVLDIWVSSYAASPPTVADTITAAAKPTLTSATKAESSTLTGWTTQLTQGQVVRFKVDSAASVKVINLELELEAR